MSTAGCWASARRNSGVSKLKPVKLRPMCIGIVQHNLELVVEGLLLKVWQDEHNPTSTVQPLEISLSIFAWSVFHAYRHSGAPL